MLTPMIQYQKHYVRLRNQLIRLLYKGLLHKPFYKGGASIPSLGYEIVVPPPNKIEKRKKNV